MVGHPSLLHPILPIAIPANDPRVLVKGRPLPTPFRIIAEDTYQRLLNLLALADETMMDMHGCFPLDDGPKRQACGMVRNITGNDFNERKRRAALAREGR
jgi:hypothetical protein